MFDPGESPQFESGSGHHYILLTESPLVSSLITSSFLMVAVKLWSMTVNEQTGASLTYEMKCQKFVI